MEVKSVQNFGAEFSQRHHFELREGCDNMIKIRPAAAELFHEEGHDEDSPKNSSTTAYCS
jgi:hypothetical protein